MSMIATTSETGAFPVTHIDDRYEPGDDRRYVRDRRETSAARSLDDWEHCTAEGREWARDVRTVMALIGTPREPYIPPEVRQRLLEVRDVFEIAGLPLTDYVFTVTEDDVTWTRTPEARARRKAEDAQYRQQAARAGWPAWAQVWVQDQSGAYPRQMQADQYRASVRRRFRGVRAL